MRSGQLRHRVSFESLPVDSGTDDYGAPLNNWTPLYSAVPARIEQLSGRELIAARQVVDGAAVEIETRYLPSITGKVRAVNDEDGTVYDILDVNDVGFAHRKLLLLCSSGLTPG